MKINTHTNTYRHRHRHKYTHVQIHKHTHTYIHTHTHTHIQHKHTYTQTCTHTHTQAHTHTHTHTQAHTQTHTQTRVKQNNAENLFNFKTQRARHMQGCKTWVPTADRKMFWISHHYQHINRVFAGWSCLRKTSLISQEFHTHFEI